MMLVFSTILIILGIISTVYGFHLNNDWEAQLEYLFNSGKSDPGTTWIVIGIIALVIGIVLLVTSLAKRQNAASENKSKKTVSVSDLSRPQFVKKRCPHCAASNYSDAAFCSVCGKELK